MPPFNSNNHGLSDAVVALLDKGLREIWEDMRVAAEIKAKSAPNSESAANTQNEEARAAMAAAAAHSSVSSFEDVDSE